jgi:hypothetical protein
VRLKTNLRTDIRNTTRKSTSIPAYCFKTQGYCTHGPEYELYLLSLGVLYYIFGRKQNKITVYFLYKCNSKRVTVILKQSLYRPGGFQEAETPRFHDIQHIKVVRLSSLCIGRLYPTGNISGPGTHFC